jgi:hydroxymethylbilane synthase
MRIGTRRSPLALAQAHLIAHLLRGAEIVELTTTGDREAGGEQARNAQAGTEDKSRWVDAIEQALLAGEVDLAVHSAKDLPGELAGGLELLGAPARAPAEDVLCLAGPPRAHAADLPRATHAEPPRATHAEPPRATHAEPPRAPEAHRPRAPEADHRKSLGPGQSGLERLAPGSRVGTSSIRRAAQLRAAREDLEVIAIGGNVDTRLRKLADPDRGLDAIVLARAGLLRLRDAGAIDSLGPGVAAETVLDPARFVPAPGQGAIALQARADDAPVRDAVAQILDGDATACLLAERSLARALHASCHTPLGAHAVPAGCGCLHLRAWIGLPDGSSFLTDELLGGFYDPGALGERVAERMGAAGARDLLSLAEEMAGAGV